MKTILMATDGSASADAALGFAVELCHDTGAELEVLAVQPRRLPGRGGGLPILEVEEPGGALRIARRTADMATEAGVRTRAFTVHGSPSESIAERAVAIGADLIVVGSRGLGSIGSMLMGSVSRELVKRSTVPVTVVSSHRDREPATA